MLGLDSLSPIESSLITTAFHVTSEWPAQSDETDARESSPTKRNLPNSIMIG
jgi:hypothetical protein